MFFLIFISISLVLLYIIILYKNSNEIERFKNFYKCKKYGNNKITNHVFDSKKIVRTYDKQKWDFYMPCGYNNVERELKTIIPNNKEQSIFGITGCDKIVSKNNLWNLLRKRYGRQQASQLMPETFLYNDIELDIFTQRYKPNKIYLVKKNLQRKLGIQLSKDYNELLSFKNEGFRLIQEYVDNLVLINQRKVNLRVYLLISCINGNIKAYINREGKCIYTNKNFSENNLDLETHLTSLNTTADIYNDRPQTFEDLKSYLGQGNYHLLMDNIVRNLILVIKATKHELCKLKSLDKNVTFQLFGLDYIFTYEMFPYILEVNKGPDMNSKNEIDKQMKIKVMNDCFKTVGIIQDDNSNSFNELKID